MTNKSDRFYYDNFIAAAECSCQAASYLVTCLSDFHTQNIKLMLEKMHQFEHQGDEKKHEMSKALAKAFVTPVDREDLALISQNIDEVTDRIEEVLQYLYMYQIASVTPEAVTFAKKIASCCMLMQEMLKEFANFKKPAQLHKMIVDLNHIEEECDALYLESTMRIRSHCNAVLDVISWRVIYSKMESCADACEHVADCVDTIVMKNT